MKLNQRGRAFVVWSGLFFALSPLSSTAQNGGLEGNTREARLAAAKEYLEVTNFRGELVRPPVFSRPPIPTGLSPELKKQFEQQQEERAKEEGEIRKKIDVNLLEQTALNALADTFTAAELQGIVKFYRSPEGKAMRAKMRQYSEKYSPVLLAELNKYRKNTVIQPSVLPAGAPPANSTEAPRR